MSFKAWFSAALALLAALRPHGGADTTVHQHHVERFGAPLEALGVPVTPHIYLRPQHARQDESERINKLPELSGLTLSQRA